jgi:hypothetical protein
MKQLNNISKVLSKSEGVEGSGAFTAGQCSRVAAGWGGFWMVSGCQSKQFICQDKTVGG